MEQNKLIKYESGALQKIGNSIAITNKLLINSNEKRSKECFRLAKEALDEYGDYNPYYAKKLINEAIELKSDFIEARRFRCSQTTLSDLDQEYSFNHKLILEDLNILLELQPNFEDYVYRSNIKLYFEYNYPEVIKDCFLAIELNDSSYEPYMSRGMARAQLNEYKDAINDFDNAIKFIAASNDYLTLSLLYSNRALMKNKLGNFIDALDDFEKAINQASKANDSSWLIYLKNIGVPPNLFLYKYRADVKLKLKDFISYKIDIEEYNMYCNLYEQHQGIPYENLGFNGNINFF